MRRLFYYFLGVSLVVAFMSQSAWAANQKITIGLNSWAENIAVAHLWKQLLDTRGYSVKLTNAAEGITWTGVAQGNIQMSMDIWLPHTDAAYYKRYKNKVNLVGPWFRRAKLGLVVPQYSPVNTIPQLRTQASKFTVPGQNGPAIMGIGAGSSEMKMTRTAIKKYHLPMQLVDASQAAMMTELKQAYDHHRNIVVTLWSPHWAWAKYKLKYLKDPKQVYGNGDHIYVITELGFARKYPKIQRWISHWHMSRKQLGKLEADIKDHGKTAGVKQWINHNSSLVATWLGNS